MPHDNTMTSTDTLPFDARGTPVSNDFDDIYFDREDGLAESRYVFLTGNSLPARWQAHIEFTLVETGFGTGLNLLATWQAWRQAQPAQAWLHYLSIEGYPLQAHEIANALTPWPELAALGDRLLAQYPRAAPGCYQLRFPEDRLQVTLFFADIAPALKSIAAPVHAWYLDGFAPAKNPAMWQPALFQTMAACTPQGGTAATFTVAGLVRRGLAAAGFTVDKTPGFGAKREVLRAVRD